MLRSGALWGIWLLILLAAHPLAPLRGASERAWELLAPWGLDVAMTPLTADMALMMDRDGAGTPYQRQSTLEIEASAVWRALDWAHASLYGVRVPLLLLADQISHGGSAAAHARAICFQLRVREPAVSAFRMRLEPPRPDDARAGVGVRWACEAERS